MDIVDGIIIKKHEKVKLVEIAVNGRDKKKFKIIDDHIWEIIDNAVGRITFSYEDKYPYPIIKHVKANVKIEVYGGKKELIDRLEKKYNLTPEVEKGALSHHSFLKSFPYMVSTGTEVDLIVLSVVIILIALIAIYYHSIIPIIIVTLASFTLSHATSSIRHSTLYMNVDSKDNKLCSTVQTLVEDAIKEKVAIEGLPTKCLERRISTLNSKLIKAYKLFRRGIDIQYASIVVLITFYLITRYYFEARNHMLLYFEVGIGVIFLLGFILSTYGDWLRKKL